MGLRPQINATNLKKNLGEGPKIADPDLEVDSLEVRLWVGFLASEDPAEARPGCILDLDPLL